MRQGIRCTATLIFVLLVLPASDAAAEAGSLGEVLRDLATNPTIAEVQAAALREASFDGAENRSLLRRLRAAAVLPRLEASVDRGMSRDEDLDREWAELDQLSLATDSDLDFRVTIRWDLDRLVYDPEEIRARRELAYHEQRRRELLVTVTRLYYEHLLHRARRSLAAPGQEISLDDRVREAQLRALLDGLTGGLLTRREQQDAAPSPR